MANAIGLGSFHEMESRERPIVVRAWGKYLEQLRGNRKPAVVVRRLAAMKIALTRGTLWQYEHGTVNAPDPVVLGGLAAIYGTDVRCLIAVLKRNRADVDMSVAEVDRVLQDALRNHDETAAAAARLEEITTGLRDIATELVNLAERSNTLAGRQTSGSRSTTTERPARARRDRRPAAAG